MTGILLGLAGVFIILVVDEIFWRLHILRGEVSRKLVHVLVGTYVAFWPFMMEFKDIQLLSLAMLVVIAVSRKFHIFQSIHDVKRKTLGEFFFPLSIGICALITQSEWVFAAAILHMSLADGLAALVGVSFGDSTRYRIFGKTKSWVGTITFYLTSLFIVSLVLLYKIETYDIYSVLIGASLPIVATLAESIAIYGTDDLLVPIVVCSMLELMQRMA